MGTRSGCVFCYLLSPLYFGLEDGRMIIVIVIGFSVLSAFTLWACCVVGKRADETLDEISKQQSEIER